MRENSLNVKCVKKSKVIRNLPIFNLPDDTVDNA